MAAAKSHKGSVDTLLNPAGFIEQHYIGPQTAVDVEAGAAKLQGFVRKLEKTGKPVLILVDISKVELTLDPKVHAAGVKAMRAVKYKRGALYGPLALQILLNTLIRVAGIQRRACAFTDRTAAISWLKEGH